MASVVSRAAPWMSSTENSRIDGESSPPYPCVASGWPSGQRHGRGGRAMSRHGGALPSARCSRRLGLAGLSLVAVVSFQVISVLSAGFSWPLPVEAATGSPDHPNRFDPRSQATTVKPSRLPTPAAAGQASTAQSFSGPQVMDRPEDVPMQPALVALDPARAVQFVGSDGVLEV